MTKRYIFALAALLGIFWEKALALDIYSHKMEFLMLEDGSGAYQKLLAVLSQNAKLSYKINMLPINRAQLAFAENSQSCLLSGAGSLDNIRHQYISSLPLGFIRLHLFNLPGKTKLTSFADLSADNTLGGLIGLKKLYDKLLPEELEIELVNNDEQNLKKLRLGRIDAVLAFLPDFRRYQAQLQYSPEFVLYQSYDSVFCHDTASNRLYIETLNRALEQITADNRYRKIMGELYMPPGF
ncbi:transporter substrate-binding domain-containing protein [Thalassomonas sp. RHCl1]|uniref:transporter substrate-binding domain-containing protein n=1 Tax=Thalassomonas sp. RHCl1 TaxID=2995320 RepID=UPI00248B61B0|nr:transporter substrate-binding domain-containing protein [Thalassomonas sp. RHCl1]